MPTTLHNFNADIVAMSLEILTIFIASARRTLRINALLLQPVQKGYV
jgi:hypothetical protein